ncbi:FAD-binding protein [Bacillus sp. FJAT-27445]|uniref:FAD-linked oxidase C-terminal domain-containing protein n=1 Tax=Bacillus sp. FJAT-27445 TaxID=1679166 RepID=UPI0006709BB3|nr:FAD-linked oxidase C-terminal domain-containing protein [Bacillus sp. FJAT-27445]KMY47264.1 FAD-binding protein [Bacillus sp. FJAT-27445]
MITKDVKEQLIRVSGPENFDDSNAGRLVYSYDATPQYQSMPDAVIAPRNTDEVSRILTICSEHRVPIVPRGSGTNLCGGTCPTEGGLVLLFKHMNRILEIDEENLTATVQPGVITLDMIKAVESKGLFYPPAEGTLGIVTEAIVKLVPKPETKKTLLALYENIDAAAQTVSDIIAAKIIPATLEFLDQPTLLVIEDYAKIGLPTSAKAVLLIEQDGPYETVERDMEKIEAICKKGDAVSVQTAQTEEEAFALTEARRSALSALARLKPTTILEDATVPRSEIANMVKAINDIAAKYDISICTFGHAGDGNLHPTCTTDIRNKDEMERVEQAFAEIFEKAIELGGTITGEHGVGEMKAPYLEMKLKKEGIDAMKALKAAFDPLNILNPGKVFAKDARKRVVAER